MQQILKGVRASFQRTGDAPGDRNAGGAHPHDPGFENRRSAGSSRATGHQHELHGEQEDEQDRILA